MTEEEYDPEEVFKRIQRAMELAQDDEDENENDKKSEEEAKEEEQKADTTENVSIKENAIEEHTEESEGGDKTKDTADQSGLFESSRDY